MQLLQFSAGPPVIGFENGGSVFTIREGESLELCVVLESGRIPSEFTFDVNMPRSQGSSKYCVPENAS